MVFALLRLLYVGPLSLVAVCTPTRVPACNPGTLPARYGTYWEKWHGITHVILRCVNVLRPIIQNIFSFYIRSSPVKVSNKQSLPVQLD